MPLIETVDIVVPDTGLIWIVFVDLNHTAIKLDVIAVRIFENDEAILAGAVFAGPPVNLDAPLL
jgi:hypothetical protein